MYTQSGQDGKQGRTIPEHTLKLIDLKGPRFRKPHSARVIGRLAQKDRLYRSPGFSNALFG